MTNMLQLILSLIYLANHFNTIIDMQLEVEEPPPLRAEKAHRKWRPVEERKAELEQRRHTLERRKRQLERRLAALDPQNNVMARKRETRAAIVLGKILRTHAILHPAFAVELRQILKVGTRRPADRELLGRVFGFPDLLSAAPPSAAGPGTDHKCSLRCVGAEITGRRRFPAAPSKGGSGSF